MRLNTHPALQLRLLAASVAVLASLALPQLANAYTSTLDTGDVVQPGHFRALVEPQLVFNRYSGVNFTGRFDTGLTDESSVRAIVGFGEVDFQIGAMYKLIPFPDTEGQPAIGFTTGFIYAKAEDDSEVNLRFHPLISNKYETEVGDITPYATLPIGLRTRDSASEVPVQIAAGAEWKTLHSENITFMGELGINLHKSFSYLSLGILFYFDDAATTRVSAAQ